MWASKFWFDPVWSQFSQTGYRIAHPEVVGEYHISCDTQRTQSLIFQVYYVFGSCCSQLPIYKATMVTIDLDPRFQIYRELEDEEKWHETFPDFSAFLPLDWNLHRFGSQWPLALWAHIAAKVRWCWVGRWVLFTGNLEIHWGDILRLKGLYYPVKRKGWYLMIYNPET